MIEISSDLPLGEHAVDAQRLQRPVFQAMWRGARGKCPACGHGRLFGRYLKVADQCPHCNEALHHQRADDAPPYFTIFAAGHIIVPLMLAFEVAFKPAIWVHMLIWGPATIALCLALLPVIKGAIVGLQWALYMHGFDPDSPDVESDSPDDAIVPVTAKA
jgi:uncharacterized protein (DUF983 family)